MELTFPVLLMDLTGVESSREWKIEEKFAEKVTQWKEEDQAEHKEERRWMYRRWTEDLMVVDDAEDDISEESEDDENDSEDVKTLKVSRFFVGKSFVSVSGLSKIFEKHASIG